MSSGSDMSCEGRLKARRRAALAAGGWPGGLTIILLGLLLSLPGLFSLPPIDRDESRFAQASRQMLESQDAGGWIVPRVQERPRLNKPPLIYWLQGGMAAAITGGDADRDAIWMYRLPSAAAFIGVLLLVWRLGTVMFDGRVGLLSALMIGTSPVFQWEARQARADMVLVFCTVLAMSLLWQIWRSERRRLGLAAALWVAVAVGIMAKGPITPMVVLLTAATIRLTTRTPWRGRIAWWLFPVVTLAVVGPWVALVMREVGAETYVRLVLDETLGRASTAKEGHHGPPGYHLFIVLGLLWPGSMLLGVGVWRAVVRARGGERARGLDRWERLAAWWRHSPRAAEAFLLAWIVPSWVVFELVSTKLPHYTMPLYAPLAVLSARAVVASLSKPAWVRERGVRLGAFVWAICGAAAMAAGPAALAELGRPTEGVRWIAWIASAVLLAGGCVLIALVARGALARATVLGIALMGVCGGVLIGVVLPGIERPWINTRLLEAVERFDPRTERPLAGVDYTEDSFVFLTRGRMQAPTAEELPDWLRANPGGVVIVRETRLETDAELEAVSDAIEGFNYSRGRMQRLRLAVEASPSAPEE